MIVINTNQFLKKYDKVMFKRISYQNSKLPSKVKMAFIANTTNSYLIHHLVEPKCTFWFYKFDHVYYIDKNCLFTVLHFQFKVSG